MTKVRLVEYFIVNLSFSQSPCEYNPCKPSAKCRALYGPNGYSCERTPRIIEEGKIIEKLMLCLKYK